MVIEIKHQNSITIYENGEAFENGEILYHATIGDRIHYPDGTVKTLATMDDVSAWLKELYFSDRKWRYDGCRNWKRII